MTFYETFDVISTDSWIDSNVCIICY